MSVVHDLINLCESMNGYNLSELSDDLKLKIGRLAWIIDSELIGIAEDKPTKFKYEFPYDKDKLDEMRIFTSLVEGKVGNGSLTDSRSYVNSSKHSIDVYENKINSLATNKNRHFYPKIVITVDNTDETIKLQLEGYINSNELVISANNPTINDVDKIIDDFLKLIIENFSKRRDSFKEYYDKTLREKRSKWDTPDEAQYYLSYYLLVQVYTNLQKSKLYLKSLS